MTDVISEENNPEKTVDELAKEMNDIIKDTYDIVVGYNPESLVGTYNFLSKDFDLNIPDLSAFLSEEKKKEVAKDYFVVDYVDGKLVVTTATGFVLNDAYGDGAYDSSTATLSYNAVEAGETGELKLSFLQDEQADGLVKMTIISPDGESVNAYYVKLQ